MRNTNLLRIAAVALSLGFAAPAAFAGETYDYVKDSAPQIQAQSVTQNQVAYAQAHTNVASDAGKSQPRIAQQNNGLTVLGTLGGQF